MGIWDTGTEENNSIAPKETGGFWDQAQKTTPTKDSSSFWNTPSTVDSAVSSLPTAVTTATKALKNTALTALGPLAPTITSLLEKTKLGQKVKQSHFAKTITELGNNIFGGEINTIGSTLGGFQQGINLINSKIPKDVNNPYTPPTPIDLDARFNEIAARVDTMKPEDKSYLNNLATGIGSTVPYLAGGIAGKLAKAPAFLANLSMSGLESLQNAHEDYKTLIKAGDTEEQAQQKSLKSFGANLVLNYFTDKLGGFFEVTKPGFKNGIKKFLTTTLFETGQEVSQQVISNATTGKPLDEGLTETALLTLPIAALFGTAGAINFESKDQKKLRTLIEDSAKSGATKDQTVKVLSTIFQVPEDQVINVVDQHIEQDKKLGKQFTKNTTANIQRIAQETTFKGTNLRESTANKTEISSELEVEAKKYNTPEEFIKGQGEPIYRGGIVLSEEVRDSEWGIPMTTKKEIAESFKQDADATTGKKTTIGEYYIDKNAKIATRKDIPQKLINDYNDINPNGSANAPSFEDEVSTELLFNWAKKEGFDGIDMSVISKVGLEEGEIKIFNNKVFKTKSQLKEIYNKAHGIDTLQENKDNKAYGNISNTRTGSAGLPESSQREKSSSGRSPRSMVPSQRWDSVAATERISKYAREDGERNKLLVGQHEQLTGGKRTRITEDTPFLLRNLGFSNQLVDKIEQTSTQGGVTYVIVTDSYNDRSYVSAFTEDTIYLNPDEMSTDLYESGAIINHELAGHSWYLKLSPESRADFYQNLKQTPETVKQAWENTNNPYKNYWNRTINKIKENIVKNSNEDVANDIINFIGLKFNSNISLDTFIDRSLNIDRQIDIINNELDKRGYSSITLKAEDTEAVQEHVAMIAENAPDIETNNTMINSYVNDVQDNNLKYGERSTQNLLYTGELDLTLKTLEKLKGRTTVSKQFIQDLTNASDLKQQEKDILRNVLETEGKIVNVKDFADKVTAELLPLEMVDVTEGPMGEPRHENTTLTADLRGEVYEYQEHVYESPIPTSAGSIHYGGDAPNYFGHTRIEDMADDTTRRVIEVQSDLYQKGNLENELSIPSENKIIPGQLGNVPQGGAIYDKSKIANRKTEVAKLSQYNDPTAHFRMVREEIKKAAQDGKSYVQFPTGETAMKVEGLGETPNWRRIYELDGKRVSDKLEIGDLKTGETVQQAGSDWIITNVLGDGKFKAVPKDLTQNNLGIRWEAYTPEEIAKDFGNHSRAETFDISGKVDTNNPIYRFYEKDLGRYLKNNYDAKPITDDMGVTWYEVEIDPSMADAPVVAFREKNEDEDGLPMEKHPFFDTGDKMADLRATLAHAEKRTGATPVKFKKIQVGNNEVELSPELQQEITQLELENEALKYDPLNSLTKFANKKEGILPEILGRNEKNKGKGKFATRGDTLLDSSDFQQYLDDNGNVDTEEVRTAFANFWDKKQLHKERVAQVKREVKDFIVDQKDELALAKIAQMESEGQPIDYANQIVTKADVKDIASMIENKDKIDQFVADVRAESKTRREEVLNHKARALSKYVQKSTGQLPRIGSDTVFGKKGQDILDELGYRNIDEAQKDYNDYVNKKNEFVNPQSKLKAQERQAKFLGEKKKVIEAVKAELRKKGLDRKQTINAIRDHFYLTDREMADILGGADIRLLTDTEFDNLLNKVQDKALEIARHVQAIAEVEYTIAEKDLHRVENLQLAMGLSQDLNNLSTEELNKLNEIIGTFEQGDVFLGQREIETLMKNTDLPHVKTQRQILEEVLVKRTGVTLEQAKQISTDWLDEFRSATSLARQNPFYEVLVADAYEIKIEGEKAYREIEKKTNELTKKARASRKRGLIDRLVPTDDLVVSYLEEGDEAVKAKIASAMTPAELELAHYIRDTYAEMRDYLVKLDMLDRVRENYYTHRPRSFLEAWLKDGAKKSPKQFIGAFARAFKETVWDVNKMDEATFKILNERTGDVLPLEKFFKYSMKRSGTLIPSRNVAGAFLGYVKTFEVKKGLDRYIPKMEAVARALTPTETTEGGLIKDESLLNFVKKWINTQKGRPTALGPIKPGGTLDILIRSGVTFTRFLDLAFRVPAQAMSLVGEQAATFINIGAQKQALGLFRSKTKQGKELIKKYESFVGQTFFTKMKDQSKDAGSKLGETIFAFYGIAARQANLTHLLGSLTKEEFESGKVSTKRLAEIKNEMNRWRADDLLASVMGKTSVGAAVRQHKSWAVPILTQTLSNITTLTKLLKNGEIKTAAKAKEAHELIRAITLTALMVAIIGNMYRDLKNKKDRNLIEELEYRAYNDIFSFLQALDPQTLFAVPRLASWATGLAGAISQLLGSMGERNEKGEIPGMRTIKQSLIPKILREPYLESTSAIDQATKAESANEKAARLVVQAKYEELKKLADTSKEEANAAFTKLEEENPDLAEKVYSYGQSTKLTPDEKKMKSLGVENGDRARYIYGELNKLDTKEEKNTYATNLQDKDIITDTVYDQIAEMVKEDKPIYEDNQEVSKLGVVNTVVTYAKAIGTDPVTAFNRIFTGQKIRRVDSGAIIVERMSKDESQAVKTKRGGNTTTMKLDHTIPLELGGGNNEKNLKLVPTAEWASYTPVENYLGKKLRDGSINKKQAQEAISKFKNKEWTFDQIKAKY